MSPCVCSPFRRCGCRAPGGAALRARAVGRSPSSCTRTPSLGHWRGRPTRDRVSLRAEAARVLGGLSEGRDRMGLSVDGLGSVLACNGRPRESV
eukprot:scaffold50_cov420-Prasinococcus_capsulatus_cf.AAC.5